jgi:hypothetical protein
MKVPTHDSLGAEPIDSNNPLFTGAASAGAGRRTNTTSARDCGNLRMLQIGTKSSQFTGLIQHVHNMGPIWGHLWPTRPTWLQLRPHGATWPQVAPFGRNFGPSSGPHGFKVRDMAGHTKSSKHVFSVVFTMFFGLSPKGSKLPPCASHGSNLGCIRINFGPTSPT